MHIDETTARGRMIECGIYRGKDGHFPDFHTLPSERVECLVELAREVGYRKPKAANGSRARYFYEYLKRAAK